MSPADPADPKRWHTVASLGSAQTLAWASSYYLPAMLAAPMARDLGVAMPTVFAATWFISTSMATHLPQLLQAVGATLAVAVSAGALVGPAQVAGRLLEFGLLRRVHPMGSARLAALGHPLGAALMLVPRSQPAAVVVPAALP